MTTTKKIESLERFLKIVSNNENLFIKKDEITGQRFAIAEKETNGNGIATKTDFWDYKQMNCYLFGVMHTQQKRIDFKK
jgi:hypothetical protein